MPLSKLTRFICTMTFLFALLGCGLASSNSKGRIQSLGCFLALLMTVFFIGSVQAQIYNKSNIYDKHAPCKAYLTFLSGGVPKKTNNCKEHTQFVINNSYLEDYFERFVEYAPEESILEGLGSTVKSVTWGDARAARGWAKASRILIVLSLARSNDHERIYFYSHILDEIQEDALAALCETDCKFPVSNFSIEKILGEEFSSLDDIRPDFTLYCLIKTEAFAVPVRKLLRSETFQECAEPFMEGK